LRAGSVRPFAFFFFCPGVVVVPCAGGCPPDQCVGSARDLFFLGFFSESVRKRERESCFWYIEVVYAEYFTVSPDILICYFRIFFLIKKKRKVTPLRAKEG
jgi:hypothetical protein